MILSKTPVKSKKKQLHWTKQRRLSMNFMKKNTQMIP